MSSTRSSAADSRRLKPERIWCNSTHNTQHENQCNSHHHHHHHHHNDDDAQGYSVTASRRVCPQCYGMMFLYVCKVCYVKCECVLSVLLTQSHLVVCDDSWVELAEEVAGHLPLPVPPVHGHCHNLLHKQGVKARLTQLHQPGCVCVVGGGGCVCEGGGQKGRGSSRYQAACKLHALFLTSLWTRGSSSVLSSSAVSRNCCHCYQPCSTQEYDPRVHSTLLGPKVQNHSCWRGAQPEQRLLLAPPASPPRASPPRTLLCCALSSPHSA